MSHSPIAEPPRPATRLQHIVGLVSTAAGIVSATMIFASVLITCQMIWIRFVMNESTVWQTESVIYLMIAATLLGLPYVQHLRGHVNVDLIPMLLPRVLRRGLAVLVLLASLAVIGVMLWHAWELWHMAFKRGWRSETVWSVPLWIPYLAMPVGFGLYVLQLAADLHAEIMPARREGGR